MILDGVSAPYKRNGVINASVLEVLEMNRTSNTPVYNSLHQQHGKLGMVDTVILPFFDLFSAGG